MVILVLMRGPQSLMILSGVVSVGFSIVGLVLQAPTNSRQRRENGASLLSQRERQRKDLYPRGAPQERPREDERAS